VTDRLTGSEAVFGFAAWLTTRDEAVTFSAQHDAAPAAELVHEFCKANVLTDPREGWSDQVIRPVKP